MYGLDKNKNFSESIYDIADEPVLATLFTTGNGYMGVRGSFEEFGSQRIQGAFVRGFIDEIIEVTEPFTDNEYMKKYYLDEEKLKTFEKQDSCVNMHDFLAIKRTVGDKTFFPWDGKILKWHRALDSTSAIYKRELVWDDGEGYKTEFVFERFAGDRVLLVVSNRTEKKYTVPFLGISRTIFPKEESNDGAIEVLPRSSVVIEYRTGKGAAIYAATDETFSLRS